MPNDAITALRESHDRLAGLLASLDAQAAGGQSYCRDWTIAQVASHLGSGAEIGLLWLRAAMAHEEPPPREEWQKIWDKWDARDPVTQVTESVPANASLVEAFEALSAEELAAARVTLFGSMEFDGGGLAQFRLPEHALHTWDVAVVLDPAARLLPSAVTLLIDVVPGYMGWLGKASGTPWTLSVRTTAPEREFVLSNAETVTLTAGTAETVDGELRLSAEAFLRLVFGRLDDANTDGATLDSDSVTMPDLRTVFPGL